MPRRPKLTPQVAETIIAAVRAGNYVETAAAYAGVAAGTVWRWLQEADKPGATAAKREFREGMERARAEAQVRMVAAIQRDAAGGTVIREVTRTLRDGSVETEVTRTPPNGRVALEYLARTQPDRWGRNPTQPIEVTGPGGGPVEVTPATVTSLVERLEAVRVRAERLAVESADDG